MKNILIVLLITVSFLFISAVAAAQDQTNTSTNSSEATTGATSGTDSNLLPPELKQRVTNKFDEYSSYTSRWSVAYWGCVFGAAILSAFAALILKLDALKDKKLLLLSQSDLAAILAGISALLITISTGGDFAGKWKANRTAKNRSEQLTNEMFNSKLTAQEIITKLNKIIDDQNNGVINVQDKPKP